MKIQDFKFKTTPEKVTFLALALFVVIGAWLVVSSLWQAIFLGLVVAYIFQPIYKAINKRNRFGEKVNVGISAILLILIVLIPLGILFYAIYQQFDSFSAGLEAYFDSSEFDQAVQNLNTQLANLNLGDITADEIKVAVENLTREFLGRTAQMLVSLIPSLFSFAMDTIVFFLVFVSVLPNMKKMRDFTVKLSPMNPSLTDVYLRQTGAITRDVVLGTFLVGFCYMIAIGGMLYIVGMPYWAIGGFAAFFLSFLPIVGPAIITVATAIILGLQGDWATGVAIILFHFLVLNNLDYILRPILVSEDAKINPTLMIIALIGGLAAFGFVGVFYGPFFMVLLVTTLIVFKSGFGANLLPIPEPPAKDKGFGEQHLSDDSQKTKGKKKRFGKLRKKGKAK